MPCTKTQNFSRILRRFLRSYSKISIYAIDVKQASFRQARPEPLSCSGEKPAGPQVDLHCLGLSQAQSELTQSKRRTQGVVKEYRFTSRACLTAPQPDSTHGPTSLHEGSERVEDGALSPSWTGGFMGHLWQKNIGTRVPGTQEGAERPELSSLRAP